MICSKRGYLLLFVLGIGSLIFLAAIASVSLSSQETFQQRFSENGAKAVALADTGLAKSIGHLLENAEWSEGFREEANEGGVYSVSFGENASLNNLRGDSPVERDGQTIPIGTAYLESTGQYGSRSVTSSALVSTGELLFEDHFTTNADGWNSNQPGLTVVLLGQWILDLSVTPQVRLFKGDESWHNYTFEADVLLTQGTGLGLLVRVTGDVNSPNAYLVGYSLLEAPERGGTFHLDRIENGMVVERIQTKRGDEVGIVGLSAWLLNVSHTYRIAVRDNALTAEVDGREVLKAILSDPLNEGRIGFQPSLLSVLLVDRVTVRTLPEVRARWREL